MQTRRTHARTQTRTQTRTHIRTHIRTHKRTHIRTHIRTHRRTHKHTRTHTYTQLPTTSVHDVDVPPHMLAVLVAEQLHRRREHQRVDRSRVNSDGCVFVSREGRGYSEGQTEVEDTNEY